METFSKQDLYGLYEKYLVQFTELAQAANKNGVHLELNVSPNGEIQFRSRRYFVANSKECVNTLEIVQGKTYVNENCRTTVLHDLKGDSGGKK